MPTTTRPDGLPDQYWDATANVPKWTDLTKELGTMSARLAEIDNRAKTLPAKPEDYKLELAPDYKPPDGVTWAWDENDPRLPQIRALAKEAGLDQGQFSRLVTAHVQHEITTKQAYETAKDAENKKLGANAAARVDAAKSGLTPILGKDGAAALMQSMVMASDVEAVEKLLRAVSNQSGSDHKNNGREPPAPPDKPLAQKLWPLRQAAS